MKIRKTMQLSLTIIILESFSYLREEIGILKI